jgi:AcrR family transcriptional regulator
VIEISKMVPEYREEAKRRIVEAGLEVMYEKGYCKTTMEDIANRLDVSKPALYRYFKNKDELVIESAKILRGQYRRITAPESPERCPVGMWIEIFDRMMSSDSERTRAATRDLRDDGARTRNPEFSVERMKHGIEQPAHAIAKQQQEGLIAAKTDPRTLAFALVSIFNGMRVMILLGVDRDELRSRWIEIVQILFEAPAECPHDCAKFEACGRPGQADAGTPPPRDAFSSVVRRRKGPQNARIWS